MEHVLRQSMIALGLAERIGLDADEREAVYFGSLLAWVGCHIDAYEQAKWFGDDTVLKSDYRGVDFATATSGPLFMMRHLGADRPLPQRLAMVPGFLDEGRRAGESLLENHWRASDDLMERSRKLLERMHAEDREEAIDLHEKIEIAIDSGDAAALAEASRALRELLFFMEGRPN